MITCIANKNINLIKLGWNQEEKGYKSIIPYPSLEKKKKENYNFKSTKEAKLLYPTPFLARLSTTSLPGQPMWRNSTWINELDLVQVKLKFPWTSISTCDQRNCIGGVTFHDYQNYETRASRTSRLLKKPKSQHCFSFAFVLRLKRKEEFGLYHLKECLLYDVGPTFESRLPTYEIISHWFWLFFSGSCV